MTLGVIEQRAGDERQQAYARAAMEKAEQMARLVDELLVFSRASLEAPTTRPQPVNVLAAAREAVAREAADGAGIRLEIPPDLRALADPAGLTRALANLLRNALRYGGPEPGTISIRAAVEPREAGVAISVADRGPGVPAGELPKIFDALLPGGHRPHARNRWRGAGLEHRQKQRGSRRRHGGGAQPARRRAGGYSPLARWPRLERGKRCRRNVPDFCP